MSPGIARGTIHVVRDDLDDVARYPIEHSQIANEIGRFETALIQTRMQILEMQQKIAESIGAKDAGIFDAHLLVVEDRTLIDEVLRKLESDLCNVEWVFQEVASNYAETLSKIDDPYLRERALDIQDVTKRVIRNLQGKAPKPFLAMTEPHILVAHNLTPSDTATMNRSRVLGIATDLGSRTSHTAIMARSLEHSGRGRLARCHRKTRDRSARVARWLKRPGHCRSNAGDAGALRRDRVAPSQGGGATERNCAKQNRPRATAATLFSPRISNCPTMSMRSRPTARKGSAFIAPSFFI